MYLRTKRGPVSLHHAASSPVREAGMPTQLQ